VRMSENRMQRRIVRPKRDTYIHTHTQKKFLPLLPALFSFSSDTQSETL